MERVIPFPQIDPIALDLGFFQIRWYALAYIFGLILGWQYTAMFVRADRLWAEKDWRKFPRETAYFVLPFVGWRIPHRRFSFDRKTRKNFQVKAAATPEQISDLLLWAALGVIVGGRLGYIFLYALWYPSLREYYLEEPIRILFTWEGGMAFHGGLIGVVVAVILFARKNRLDPFRLADVMAPAVPIGILFGRLANFINGELWGKVTIVPWGVVFPHPEAGPLPRHPSQLYEAGLEGLVLFAILSLFAWKTRALHKRGFLLGVFLLCYGLSRILVEFFRETKDFIGSPDNWFTMGMLFSIPMALAGLAFIWIAMKRPELLPKTIWAAKKK